MTFAAGLACEGMRPVVAIYSTFLQRAYDQLIHDVVLQNLPVVFAIDRAGVVGADGATHIGAFDLCVPALPAEHDGDDAVRRERMPADAVHGGHAGHAGGGALSARRRARRRRSSRRCTRCRSARARSAATATRRAHRIAILAFGSMLQPALAAAEELDATVANMRFVKPLDVELVLRARARARRARHRRGKRDRRRRRQRGGRGARRGRRRRSPILHLGLPDHFIDHGDPAFLLAHVGLDAKGIAARSRARFGARAAEPWAKPAA